MQQQAADILKTFANVGLLPQLRSVSQTIDKFQQARPFEEIPRPTTFQLIRGVLPGGAFHNLDIPGFAKKARELYGDLYILPGFLGRPDMLIAFNPDDMLTVLRAEGDRPYRRGFETMEYHRTVHKKLGPNDVSGLVGVNGENWSKVRTAVNPILMKPKNAKLYLNNMLEVSDEFLQRIREIRDPQSFEVPETFEDEIKRLTFESVNAVALNRQLGLIRKNRNDKEAKLLFDTLQNFFQLLLEIDLGPPIWKYYKTKKFKQQMKNYDIIGDICSKYVNEALDKIENDKTPRKENEESSVLEKLLKVDRNLAKAMAQNLIAGSIDTTSSTLAGILICIAKNQMSQEKLRQEIKSILPQKHSLLTIDSMNNLPYLRACIKEGMRMYPIGGGTIRSNVEDIVMSGYRVPKGQEIVLNHNFLLNTDEYCPKASEFIPERWLRGEDSGFSPVHPFLHMPFGFGPRSCVARRIVELELEITVARMVRNFYIEFNCATENAFKNRLINVPAVPLTFKFMEVDE